MLRTSFVVFINTHVRFTGLEDKPILCHDGDVLCTLNAFGCWIKVLFLYCRLLVNLTQPALLCFGNKVPKEADQYHNYLDILALNVSYKQVGLRAGIGRLLC